MEVHWDSKLYIFETSLILRGVLEVFEVILWFHELYYHDILLICMLRQEIYGLEVVLSSYVSYKKETKALNMSVLFSVLSLISYGFLHHNFEGLWVIFKSRLLHESCGQKSIVSNGSRISSFGVLELKLWPFYWKVLFHCTICLHGIFEHDWGCFWRWVLLKSCCQLNKLHVV